MSHLTHADAGWISVTPGDYVEVSVLRASDAALKLMSDAGTLWRSWLKAKFAAKIPRGHCHAKSQIQASPGIQCSRTN